MFDGLSSPDFEANITTKSLLPETNKDDDP
jgi:hypothetical protein